MNRSAMPYLLDPVRGPARLLRITGVILLVGGLMAFESTVGSREVWTFEWAELAYVKEPLGLTDKEYGPHSQSLASQYLEVGRTARFSGLLLLAASTAIRTWRTRRAFHARAAQATLLGFSLWILVLRAPAPGIPSLSLLGLPLLTAYLLLEFGGSSDDASRHESSTGP